MIDKCETFPNKDFNIDEYDAKLTWGRADVKSGVHNCMFIYDTTYLPFNSERLISTPSSLVSENRGAICPISIVIFLR
jgi:hypothetical protein